MALLSSNFFRKCITIRTRMKKEAPPPKVATAAPKNPVYMIAYKVAH
jgi:hypothetical protein